LYLNENKALDKYKLYYETHYFSTKAFSVFSFITLSSITFSSLLRHFSISIKAFLIGLFAIMFTNGNHRSDSNANIEGTVDIRGFTKSSLEKAEYIDTIEYGVHAKTERI